MFRRRMSEDTMGAVRFGLFGLAVICAFCAVIALMRFAGIGIREEVAYHRPSAAQNTGR
jgi:hypothetical protein